MTHHLSDGILVRSLFLGHILQTDVEQPDERIEESFCNLNLFLVCLGDEVDDLADGVITGTVAVFDFVFLILQQPF